MERCALPDLQLTGRPLPHTVFYGKPHPAPYRLIEALLRGQAARLGLDASPAAHAQGKPLPFSAIYAVRI